jgi:hypothetical protein
MPKIAKGGIMTETNIKDIQIWLLVEMSEFQRLLENATELPPGSKLLVVIQNPYLEFSLGQLMSLISLNDFVTKNKGVKLGIVDQHDRVHAPLRTLHLENSILIFASMRLALPVF